MILTLYRKSEYCPEEVAEEQPSRTLWAASSVAETEQYGDYFTPVWEIQVDLTGIPEDYYEAESEETSAWGCEQSYCGVNYSFPAKAVIYAETI